MFTLLGKRSERRARWAETTEREERIRHGEIQLPPPKVNEEEQIKKVLRAIRRLRQEYASR